MNSILRISTLLLLSAVFVLNGNAQSKFEKETSDASKIEKKVKRDFPLERGKNGGGYAPYYPALKTPPKKVALVTFAVFDPGYTESKSTSSYMSWKTTRNSDEDMQAMLDGWYGQGLEPLKKAFTEHGMELLTPDQFLDTKEKQAAFDNFEFEGKKSDFINKTMTAGTQVSACFLPEGYKELIPKYREVYFKESVASGLYSNCIEFKKREIYDKLGYDLCNQLGVDAILVVNNTVLTKEKITTVKKTPVLMSVDMYMFGPNPIQIPEGEKEPMVYRKGSFFGGYTLMAELPARDKKNWEAGIISTGYGNIMTAMANTMGVWLKEETAKPDKRK